jgi:hypothetical protein
MNKIFLSLIFSVLISFLGKAYDHIPGQGRQKSIYVSTSGNDGAEGSAAKPLRTITKAVSRALPGEKILVSAGVYRESVVFGCGGSSENTRITLEALNAGKVTLKGSDRKTGWIKGKNKLWKCSLDSTIKELMLFSNGEKLVNVPTLQECSIAFRWMREEEKGKTVIWANFGAGDPNVLLTEVAVRKFGISAKANVDYITIKGINVTQIANDYASIYTEQPGAIDTKNGKHWDILNCSVSDCRAVGISIGVSGHIYEDITPRKPEFSDYTDMIAVGHHNIKNNHIFNCGQAGIFGLLGGTSSTIEDNLIENINQDRGYTGTESAGIRLAMSVDAAIVHNLVRRINGENSYGIFLGPIFQGTKVSRNIVSDSEAGLFYLFKNHGPALFDNNILVMADSADIGMEGVKMMASEANVFVQNLFYNCSFSNGLQPGRSVSTSNFLPHSLVIKQTIPALNIDHRWYGNLFIGKGAGITKVAGCEADFNLYADGALSLEWADPNSVKAVKSFPLRLEHNPKGVELLLDKEALNAIKIPAFTADFLGFFALSKQYVEYPNGKKITVGRDFLETGAGNSPRYPGPFYQGTGLQQKIKLF